METKIMPFSNNLPPASEFIVGDCCFVYDYYWANSIEESIIKPEDKARIREVKQASKKLAENNNIIIIPPILREELIGIAERDIIGNESYSTKQQMAKDPSLILKAIQRVKNIETVLRENPLFLFDDDKVEYDIEEILQIEASQNLRFKDAKYTYYTKKKYEINNMITVDKDFTRVTDETLNVYVDNKSYEFYIRSHGLRNSVALAFQKAINSK